MFSFFKKPAPDTSEKPSSTLERLVAMQDDPRPEKFRNFGKYCDEKTRENRSLDDVLRDIHAEAERRSITVTPYMLASIERWHAITMRDRRMQTQKHFKRKAMRNGLKRQRIIDRYKAI